VQLTARRLGNLAPGARSCIAVVCLLGGACQREPERAPPSPPASAPVATRPEAGATPDAAAAVGEAAADEPTSGEWQENPTYKFRLDGFKRCGGADGGQPSWLGFSVEVATKVGPLFVSPRDVSLARGGVVLEPSYLDQKPLPNCSPLLPQRQLRPGQSVRGVVLFEIPPSFKAASGPIELGYRPTRWGGAPHVEVKIPSCLDACADVAVEKPRGPARPRKSR